MRNKLLGSKFGGKAFTLIEMSIVITIIALIIGGVLVGKNLVRTSQIQAVTSEVARYRQAITDFRDKYMALPGDFSGATALWGSADGVVPSDTTCQTTPSTGTLTCDGNGDGRITIQSADTTANEYEQFRAWQHLANAGMIDGHYTGVSGADPIQAITGTNVPASQLTGGGYSLISMLSGEIGLTTGTHYFTGVNYMHMLQFGQAYAAPASTIYPVITTSEAQSIDSKIDDGFPSTGNVMGPVYNSAYSPSCSTNATPPLYDNTQITPTCSLLFLLGF